MVPLASANMRMMMSTMPRLNNHCTAAGEDEAKVGITLNISGCLFFLISLSDNT